MVKRTLLFLALTAVLGTALPRRASAERCIMGRVTALTGTTITVYDKEKITFSVDQGTRYTRWITN